MPAGSYTTEALVSSVRRRAYLPAADDGTSFPRDSDIIALANEEMVSFLVPWLMEKREGHFLQSTDIPLVSGQAAYTVPQRAAYDNIALAQLVDSSGNPQSWPGLQEVDLEQATQYPAASSVSGTPGRFYWLNNTLVLAPTPSSSALSLRLYYPQRPNQLVASSACVAVTDKSQVGASFQLFFASGTAPSTFTSTQTYELVRAQPGFEVVALGTPTALTSTSVTFTGTLPTVNVGDWLCLQDTAPVMTYVPADLLPMFAQWLALVIPGVKRDADGASAAKAEFQRLEKAASRFLGRRDQLGHRKVSFAATRGMGRLPPFFVK